MPSKKDSIMGAAEKTGTVTGTMPGTIAGTARHVAVRFYKDVEPTCLCAGDVGRHGVHSHSFVVHESNGVQQNFVDCVQRHLDHALYQKCT